MGVFWDFTESILCLFHVSVSISEGVSRAARPALMVHSIYLQNVFVHSQLVAIATEKYLYSSPLLIYYCINSTFVLKIIIPICSIKLNRYA